MAQKTINARAKNKRDTSSNWTANDPVLLDGEIIIVDTADGEVREKIGDGVKTYTQLPFTDEKLRNLLNNKQDAISVSGVLQGDGNGNITAANVVTFEEGATVEDVESVDADTLGGYDSSYYASKASVDSLSASVSNTQSSVDSLNATVSSLNTAVSNVQESKMDKSGGTMSGALVAQNNTDYEIKQVRNIFISSADPTDSDGADGDIWLKYESSGSTN